MSSDNLSLIKNFINNFTIETTPNVYKKYESFSDLIDKNHLIYITYLPDENSQNVIDTAKKLINEGYDVIPHLPARTIINKSELEKYIASLSEKSGCNKILVIGGGGNQKGEISSTLEVLETEYLSKYNFIEVGVAGHPEGSPDIKMKDLDKAIIDKNNFSANADYKMYLATQFFFEAKSLVEWEKHLKSLGNKLDICAGIPGPASLKTLLSYAKSCGIKNSLSFLSKQAFNLAKLATPKTPDKLIYDLANYKNNNDETNLKKLHFYPFGGIKKTSEWLNSLKNANFVYNSKNEFEIVSE
tara:strand:- start:2142 stop:3041 length:900 start_codon:yes stop_codon:yes gene_type:complete